MTGAVTIRRARPEEAALLTALSLRSKASNGYDEAFMARCVAELTVTPERVATNETWVAEEAGRVLAFIEMEPGPEAEIHSVFAEPDCRRKGVGRLLWAHMEERARAAGARALLLDADPFAVPFYESMGMRIVGQSPSGSIPGRMLPRMRKDL
ncbi:GNAT family N-acetyltransferase [Kaustia mangrovi]|uniref:GNAT family N-acetyltransferase n=1 Tax=Kaustia mangrovi TaxID=2593653 RepID=A0A7S8C872_9HYPH|nr:GNAT family N-acetyltransferase [Kaustia mangrovi]